MPPEVYTPKQIQGMIKPQEEKSSAQIANKTLSDLNEVLKTVSSITSSLGFNLKDILAQKPKEQTSNATQIEAQVDKIVASTPKPQLVIDTSAMMTDIQSSTVKIDDNITGKEFKEMLATWNETGITQAFLTNLINKYVRIQ